MLSVKEFKLSMFSNHYYRFINDFAKTDYESNKLLGKFYTDYNVADEMIERVVESITFLEENKTVSIIDPFCGDGRLIISLLKKIDSMNICKKIHIVIWDVDNTAIQQAKKSIEIFLKQTTLEYDLSAELTDAFVAYFDEVGKFDICVTNPPWGLLKPQKLFNTRCSEDKLNEYRNSIAMYDDYMKQEFSVSLPTSKFGKWGTNIGRCGLEVALRLIAPNGVCGFVSPASLFNDQVSLTFRKWIFENYNINSIAYFPAELKLYGSADVSSITAVVKVGTTQDLLVKVYDSEFNFTKRIFDNQEIQVIEDNDYSIPLEFGVEAMKLETQLKKCITLEEYCKHRNLAFVRELDETRVAEKLTDNGNIVFAKGYMVDRYSFSSEKLYLNESIVQPPKSVEFHKLVWRDVSRNSQQRRIKATIINPKCIAGNSLGAIYSTVDDLNELKILLAIINSYVFEFQARRKLVSNHVPVGILKKVKVPNAIQDDKLIQIVTSCLNGKECQAVLEVKIAKLYGIDYDEYFEILKFFSISPQEIEELKTTWKSTN